MAAEASLHGVVSTAELLAAGLSRRELDHLVAIGFLHARHRGVWAVGRPDITFLGACRAALLACGPDSAISHITSAALDGYRESAGRIHVSAPRSREGHPGLIVHRPRSLAPDDIVERDGVRRTSVARTLLDMSPKQPVDRIARWMHEAGVQRVLDQREVWAVLARHPHHRGRRRLTTALAVEVAPTRSGAEEAYLRIWRELGLPRVRVNEWVWTGERLEEADFVCEELGLIIEIDGARYHASRHRRRKDAEKTQRLRDAGWIVERFSDVALALDAAGVRARTLDLAGVGRDRSPVR